MQIHVEVVIEGQRERQRIATIQRSADLAAVDGLGLTLAESKDFLERLQATVVRGHADELVVANSACGGCGQPLARKGTSPIVYRTAFGKFTLSSPRLYSQCRCGARACARDSFNPLAMHLAQRTHPELLYLQTRWASAMSFDRAAKLLSDVLPLGAAPGPSSIKAHVRAAGQALATEAEEHGEHFFAEQPLRFPDPPTDPAAHVLELDAAYVRAIPERCGGRSTFGIVTGRLIKPEGASGWHAYVIDETINPLTQLHGFLDRQCVAIDTPMAIITDGGADVGTPTILSWRPTQVILDWFHISMRFEHMLQRLRGLCKTALKPNSRLLRYAESAKWRLWHGRADGSLERLRAIQAKSDGSLLAHVSELIAYLSNNSSRLVNYSQRCRAGLPVSTSTAESAVESVIGDRFKKNRKMRWTHKGANALLHIRVAELNGELKEALKRRHWKRPRAANDDYLDWVDFAAWEAAA
jgi:hypothetical protein